MTESKLSRRDSLRGLLTVGAAGAAVALTGAVVATPAEAAQPNMNAALALLRQARGALDVALPNKGGYRVKALKEVDLAIADTVAGIAYAKAHP